MACHNLLQDNPLPSGTNKLLGLGLNYCIRNPSTRETTKRTFNHLTEDVRRLYALRDVENDEGNYIPSLYIKSDYRFDPAPVLLERALVAFQTAIKNKQQDLRNRRKDHSMNLTHGGWNRVQYFNKNDDYIIVAGDKNLGPCILDRKVYIEKGCSEHLGNIVNYKVLTRNA